MSSVHHVIYLPGLGDDKFSRIQIRLLKLWRIHSLSVHYHYIGWADQEPFAPKLERILADIDACTKPGDKVSLIGVSAGASAAIDAYAARQQMIYKVVCICGKLQNPQTVSPDRFQQNPAFRGSLDLLSERLSSLEPEYLGKIVSLRPLRDGVVPPADTIIKGARTGLLPMVGHSSSILYTLTLGSFRIARYLKQPA